jgi:hypothetical protein
MTARKRKHRAQKQTTPATQRPATQGTSLPPFGLAGVIVDRQANFVEPTPDQVPKYATARQGRHPLAYFIDDAHPVWMSMDERLIKRLTSGPDSGLDPNDRADRNSVIGTMGASLISEFGWTDGWTEELDRGDLPPMVLQMIPATEHTRRHFVMTLGA